MTENTRCFAMLSMTAMAFFPIATQPPSREECRTSNVLASSHDFRLG